MTRKISEKEVYKSNVFTIKDVEVEHDGGERVIHQIMEGADISIIVPLKENGNVIFIKEYHTAFDEYNLDLPGGKIEAGSNEIETAERELQEEIGYKPGNLNKLGMLTITPGYNAKKSYIFLAQELIKSKLQGDEKETLEKVEYPLEKFEELIDKGDLREARAIAALYLARRFLRKN